MTNSAAKLATWLGRTALVVMGLSMLLPFLWMLSTSLKADAYVLAFPPQILPTEPTWASYQKLGELFPMTRLFVNSVVAALITTGGQLLTSSLAAYAFARIEFRGRNALFLLYLATLMIPFQVTITPLFILMRLLHWLNSYQGLILPGISSAFGVFLLRQAFLSIPRELEEAALMDGASPWVLYRQIVLPLARPALATLAIFAFMNSWNSFLWPLFVLRDEALMTLPVGLATLHGRWLTQWNLVMAGAVITVLPMLVVYLFAQRYFEQGVVLSGLKG